MAGDEWPEFNVPAEALLPVEDRDPSITTTPPVVPPAATAPPAGTPAAAPAVGAHGTTEPPPATTPNTSETVPKYRLDETIEARRAAELRADRLEAQLRELQSRPPAAAQPPATSQPPQGPAVTQTPEQIEADEKVRARLQELYPELKSLKNLAALAQRSGDLDRVVEAQQRYEAAETKFYDRHTEAQLGNLHTLAAQHVLGDGKTAKDLPEMVKDTLSSRFAAWCAADPERSQRYNDLDTALVGEFWPIFRAAMYDPVQRASSAAAVTAATTRPPLPTGGSQTAPLSGAPPKPGVPEDEDAIHSRAWREASAASQG